MNNIKMTIGPALASGFKMTIGAATGPTGLKGDTGNNGTDGLSSYTYIAYAQDDQGTGFTTIFNGALDYIAIKTTSEPIENPQASDFVGLWKNYKGADGAGSSKLIASYTHSGNKEVHVTAIDTDTNIFTSVGHGLVSNNTMFMSLNVDAGRVIFLSTIPGGIASSYFGSASNPIFYAKVIDADHFTISQSYNGADIDITSVGDVTKWHFERQNEIDSVLLSNFPANIRRIRVVLNGHYLSNSSFLYLKPNSINSGGFVYDGSNHLAYPWMAQSGVVYNHSEAIIDSNNQLCWMVNRFRSYPNLPALDSAVNNAGIVYTDARYTSFDINSLLITGNTIMANGTRIDVYKEE
jgi:hypothetical protein